MKDKPCGGKFECKACKSTVSNTATFEVAYLAYPEVKTSAIYETKSIL